MPTRRTWVLVADANHARFFRSNAFGDGLHEDTGITLDTSHPKNHEIERDKPARVFESVGHARHAVERHNDPRRLSKRKFAETIAEELSRSFEAKAFDRLVVVAPATMLGDLRATLSPHVKTAVVAEYPKDLTHAPISELGKILAELVPL